ncbi:MAG: hypothetical protein DRI65_00100 [Chloroflexota bacterium]|nr:MAG: hypothetical protein DRI65_00100 [Chloroflexota bacterium]
MKMIFAIMPTSLSDQVTPVLLDKSYRVTKFASTSGLLSGGITTLMIITTRDKIARALELIRENIPPAEPTDTAHARVTIYVLAVKGFEKV